MATLLTVPSWINGAEQTHDKSFPVVSPSTGQPCWNATSASPADAICAVEAAEAALPAWKATKPAQRQAILLKAAALLEERAQDLCDIMSAEMGADTFTAENIVLKLAVQMMRDCAYRCSSICGSAPTVLANGQSAMVWKEPYGVVLGITAWNAPYVFASRAIANAISTGNTTVIKSSELAPRCGWAVGRALSDAGLPPGVVNIISCQASDAPDVVKAMIDHPAVKKVNFTGSAAVGRKIAIMCSQNLKPSLMELGGKNSAIILPDADLEKAAQACILGGFANQGQICMATSRLVILKQVASRFFDVLKQRLDAAQAQKSSPPVVVTANSASRLRGVLADAEAKGAKVLSGGQLSSSENTARFLPTVIDEVNPDMEAWKEENFGPLIGCVVAETEDEAVEIANSSPYGLSASIFTQDLRKGFALARKIEAGAVHINTMTIQDEPPLPFGGVKQSGWGRFNAEEGMKEFLVTKCVTWDD
ncbi:hypothetical protein HIM_04160 [Hirsutella minnesotensis 3608]|uniref:Aldehyde dehydrogenase domain-containing protein n=1 Tax=Hirsutella minnesotensis 3608 TaxID=1043627 RepID=A0A0F7ZLH7_9HYPO|nr:hypothetical protein HIM_04160 [Hirsutella minnesotensis 3608]